MHSCRLEIAQWETDGGRGRSDGAGLMQEDALAKYSTKHKAVVAKLAESHMLLAKLVITSDRGRWWNEADLDIHRLNEIDDNLSAIDGAIHSIERSTARLGIEAHSDALA